MERCRLLAIWVEWELIVLFKLGNSDDVCCLRSFLTSLVTRQL